MKNGVLSNTSIGGINLDTAKLGRKSHQILVLFTSFYHKAYQLIIDKFV